MFGSAAWLRAPRDQRCALALPFSPPRSRKTRVDVHWPTPVRHCFYQANTPITVVRRDQSNEHETGENTSREPSTWRTPPPRCTRELARPPVVLDPFAGSGGLLADQPRLEQPSEFASAIVLVALLLVIVVVVATIVDALVLTVGVLVALISLWTALATVRNSVIAGRTAVINQRIAAIHERTAALQLRKAQLEVEATVARAAHIAPASVQSPSQGVDEPARASRCGFVR